MSQAVDNSIRQLTQTGAQVQKLLLTLPATIESQLAEIQNNENTIADQSNIIEANQRQIETDVRSAAAEVRLQIKEDRKAVLTQLLADESLIATTEAQLSELKTRAVVAEQEAATEVQKAVKAAESALHAKYGSEISNLKADHKVQTAELNAKATSDATTIELLKGQIESLEATIKANREADVAKAEAASKASGVVVNTGK